MKMFFFCRQKNEDVVVGFTNLRLEKRSMFIDSTFFGFTPKRNVKRSKERKKKKCRIPFFYCSTFYFFTAKKEKYLKLKT
jgi:hypothetical protein